MNKLNKQEQAIIDCAIAILDNHTKNYEFEVSQPEAVINYLRLHLELKEYEVFGIFFLNAGNRVIEFEEMFRGTINRAEVYPREIIKQALAFNAVSIIIAHNHPSSGNPLPSDADINFTRCLRSSLDVVDVKILDHIIIGHNNHFSFNQEGVLY